jgi:hypothetical protein
MCFKQEDKTDRVWGLVQWEGEDVRKDCKRVIMIEILWTRMKIEK